MDIKTSHINTVHVIAPTGRVDQNSCTDLEAKVLPLLDSCRHDGTPFVIDMTHVDYISSAGLRVLMLAAKKVASQKGKIALANLQPFVKEVFDISRFNMVFKIYPSVITACEALESGR